MVSAPAAMTNESPTRIVRAVWSVPYQSMSEDPTGLPSQSCRPRIDPLDENGPKVMAAVLEADPAGDAAAPNKAVTRE